MVLTGAVVAGPVCTEARVVIGVPSVLGPAAVVWNSAVEVDEGKMVDVTGPDEGAFVDADKAPHSCKLSMRIVPALDVAPAA